MYVVDYEAPEPIMLINKHIGMDAEDGMGVDAAEFQRELLQLDGMGKKRIQVWLNCPGGRVMDAMNIINAILKTNTPVDTYNIGIVASMGAAIWAVGRKRFISDYAKTMVHNPSGGEDRQQFISMKDAISTIMCSKCGMDKDKMNVLMDRTTWMTASECFENGLATDIESTGQANKKWVSEKAQWKEIAETTNSLLPQKKKSMKKVTALLRLNEDASEDSIMAAIQETTNKLAEQTAALATSQQTASALTIERDALKLKSETLEQTMADNKAVADAEAAAALKEKAVTMVTGFVKIGKIKKIETDPSKEDANVTKWVNLAVADFDGTKKILEDLPLNVSAAKVSVTTTGDALIPMTAQLRMIQIAAKHKQ